ncbi:MAG: bifunctional 2-polyprenyl-6-hydroxyphenol methylase/3-demethylubiquinol 3-O-methyltransferase UbiG [Alphaproteobacteria bacterium]|nr:bifunctional 2-polyprenyl-6-hydroxyphenol methylase/3-demethylubiquinol 3-O-methyltransferase UbiG [Alphaproteobacteria bacterium]
MTAPASSLDAAEIEKFAALAQAWWDPKGEFAPLHALNPPRLDFIREQALAHFGRDPRARRPFEGLRLLDVGCGGGLVCEPMARLGFTVTGLDGAEPSIGVARAHAEAQRLAIDYRVSTVEAMVDASEAPFDLVLALEVVEHVADPRAFLRDVARLTAPGGLMIVSTLNRTAASLMLGKAAAEYVLRWAPPGTHDWRRFLKPEEMREMLSEDALSAQGPFGLVFDPVSWSWRLGEDCKINYFMTFSRPARTTKGEGGRSRRRQTGSR